MGIIEKETQKRPLWEALVNGGATSDSDFAPAFQYKTVTPTKSQQIIEADLIAGFDGLGQVTVERIPEEYIYPSGVLSVSQIGVFPVAQFQSLLFAVDGDEENDIIERKLRVYENSRVSIVGSGFYAVDYDDNDPPAYGLERVSFPNATVVGEKAFYNCIFLSDAYIPNCENIGIHAFYRCSLSEVSFPRASSIGRGAFYLCQNLKSVDFPNVSTIGSNTFGMCSELTTVNLPQVGIIPSFAFTGCIKLTEARFYNASYIHSEAFSNCYNLISLYLLGSSVCSLQNKNAFLSTPISGYTGSTGGVHGSIFVPSSLYDAYISMANWSFYSDRFVSLTDEEIAEQD